MPSLRMDKIDEIRLKIFQVFREFCAIITVIILPIKNNSKLTQFLSQF